MASKKRLCFQQQTEPAASAERDGSSSQFFDSDDDSESMDIDSMAEDLSAFDSEMGSAVAGLLSMRRSGSSDVYNFEM